MIRYIGKRFFVRLVLLTAVILGVVGLFSWAEGGPTKKLGLSLFRGTQYVYVDRGITVPVSGKRPEGTIRALAEDLRYDDLLDLYPSMGTWPHRMTEAGQMYFPTRFVMRQGKDAWALLLDRGGAATREGVEAEKHRGPVGNGMGGLLSEP